MFATPEQKYAYNRAYYLRNKERILKNVRRWSEQNKNKIWEAMIKRKYGLSLEQYEAFVEKQAGRCAICIRSTHELGIDTFAIDHDHTTGKVRGLLCPRCNLLLANALDDTAILESAIDYLGSTNTQSASTQSADGLILVGL